MPGWGLIILIIVAGLLICSLIGFVTLCVWMIQFFTRDSSARKTYVSPQPKSESATINCVNCQAEQRLGTQFCGECGFSIPAPQVAAQVRDLTVTAQQIKRLQQNARLDAAISEQVLQIVHAERSRLLAPEAAFAKTVSEQIFAESSETANAANSRANPASRNQASREPISNVQIAAAEKPIAPPRRTFGEIFASFLEEHSIRWGELLGGLLIVGCSAALVTSFWSQISALPVVQFVLFTLVTAALFAVGFYTNSRWKLPTTSRGLLLISTLLVPLNMLAVTAAAAGAAIDFSLVVAGEAIAAIIFIAPVYFAARALTAKTADLLAFGVGGACVAQFFISRAASADTSAPLLLTLAALPTGLFIAANFLMLRRESKDLATLDNSGDNAFDAQSEDENSQVENQNAHGQTTINNFFVTLGVTAFASGLAIALLFFKTVLFVESPANSFDQTLTILAAPLAAFGLPPLFIGLTLWRKLWSRRLALPQTWAIALAIFGAFAVQMGFWLAFPNAVSVVASALLCFAAFTIAVRSFDLPQIGFLHLLAALNLAVAYLIGFQILINPSLSRTSDAAALLSALTTVSSAQAAVLLVVALAALAELFKTKSGKLEKYYLIAWAGAAVYSCAVLAPIGFAAASDPFYLSIILTVYAVCAVWVGVRAQNKLAVWTSSWLVLFALMQTFAAWFSIASWWQIALLAHATAAFGGWFALHYLVDAPLQNLSADKLPQPKNRFAAFSIFAEPFAISSLVSAGVAACLLILESPLMSNRSLAWRALWLAAIWLMFALVRNSAAVFNLAQAAVFAATVCAVNHVLESADWYPANFGWLHPRSLQTEFCAVAAVGLLWFAARFAVARFAVKQNDFDRADTIAQTVFERILADVSRAWLKINSARWTFDRAAVLAVLALFIALILGAALPAVASEIALADFSFWQTNGLANVLGWTTFAAFGLIGWWLTANFSERFARVFAFGLLLLAASAPLAIAGSRQNEFAAASVWRWLAAIVLLIAASILAWRKQQIKNIFERAADRNSAAQTDFNEILQQFYLALFALTALPVISITSLTLWRIIANQPVGAANQFFGLIGIAASHLVPLLLVGAALLVVALREKSANYLFCAGLMLPFAATAEYILRWHVQSEPLDLAALILINANAVALAGIVWARLEDKISAHGETAQKPVLSFFRFAVFSSLAALGAVVAIGLNADLTGREFSINSALAWTALAAIAVLLYSAHRKLNFLWTHFYVLTFIGTSLALENLHLAPRFLGFAALLALAVFAVLTTFIRTRRAQFGFVSKLFGASANRSESATEFKQLIVADSVLVATICWLVLWTDSEFAETSRRILAAFAAALQILTFARLANYAENNLAKQRLQQAAFAVAGFAVVVFGWAWLAQFKSFFDSGEFAAVRGLLDYTVVAAVALAVLAGGLTIAATRWLALANWSAVWRNAVRWTAAVGFGWLVLTLLIETAAYLAFGKVETDSWAIIAVGCLLIGASVAAIRFAVSESIDSPQFSPNARAAAVYFAEVMLALLFVHLRVTLPELFGATFSRYWAIIIIALAFAAVGIGELLRRQNRAGLSEPLERTGALLPILPVISFWIAGSEINFGALLFFIGLLYAALSLMRQSFVYGMLAALCGNGGLWYVLHRTENYGFADHPQLWLIPAALSVLAAAHLNRTRLAPEQTALIRYLALAAIYVSSTVEIFLNGVASSPVLPVILAALSIAGVLTGIWLRARAFLIFGILFLNVSLLTMVWYAAASFGWTWLWYVAGIVAGTVIIAAFALFEKKRTEILNVAANLREWEN